jgi:hypothetical protein
MPQKKAAAASSAGSAASGALHTTQNCEESAPKHPTEKVHEHCSQDDGDMGLSPEVDADTAKGTQESDSGEAVRHVEEEDPHVVQEAELLIQEMDACGIGEPISHEEFDGCLNRLPSAPPWIDLEDTLEDEEIDEQEARLALYRLRYLKHKVQSTTSPTVYNTWFTCILLLAFTCSMLLHVLPCLTACFCILLRSYGPSHCLQFLEQASEGELQDDKLKSLLNKSEDDCDQDFLEKEGFFSRFEKDYTLDWFFHPDYLECSSLNDYQRLVLRNYVSYVLMMHE